MITVAEALTKCLALTRALEVEDVPLAAAGGRVLAAPVTAPRDQPPFAAAAMDGYALRQADAVPGATLTVVGTAPAGRAWDGRLSTGQAVRIFTGAPIPTGADRVARHEDQITLNHTLDPGHHIRAAGADFRAGARITALRRLGPADLALAAAMNAATLRVTRRPDVALIATGDELVRPGQTPRPDQIIASNTYGLKALVEAEGGHARLLPIARDTETSLRQVLDLAKDADLIVTIGGASVGDHDLVGHIAADMGLEQAFYKVAMRPGKPLMAGRLGASAMLGLPGNPVSALVCGHVFLAPMVRAFLGLSTVATPRRIANLGCDIPANGPRTHFMRAKLHMPPTADFPHITPFERQDSSLLSVFAQADALLVRPAHDGPRQAGDRVTYLPIAPMQF